MYVCMNLFESVCIYSSTKHEMTVVIANLSDTNYYNVCMYVCMCMYVYVWHSNVYHKRTDKFARHPSASRQ